MSHSVEKIGGTSMSNFQAVSPGQREAGLTLGFGERQMILWRVLLPQALPAMLPTFGNQLIVTHEMGFARDSAERVIFMEGGRIVEDAVPEVTFSRPREKRTAEFLSRVLDH